MVLVSVELSFIKFPRFYYTSAAIFGFKIEAPDFCFPKADICFIFVCGKREILAGGSRCNFIIRSEVLT